MNLSFIFHGYIRINSCWTYLRKSFEVIVTGAIQEIRERSHSALIASVVRLSATRERILVCRGKRAYCRNPHIKMSFWYVSYRSYLEENISAVYL